MLEAQVGKQSQSHKLKERLQEAGITHGETARVDLSGIRVGSADRGGRKKVKEPQVYFCRVGPVRVVERLEDGDGGPLPEEAELADVSFPRRGVHHLESVVVHTNGRMKLEADEKTEIRKVEGPLARLGRFFRRLAQTIRSGTGAVPRWR